MNEIAKLVIQSGILSEAQLAEFQRWGHVTGATVITEESPKNAFEFMQRVEMALQKEDMVLIRETDFEALHNYLKTQLKGWLHLESHESQGNSEVIHTSDVEVSYSVSKTGEYLIPWMGENVEDLLVNGFSYLAVGGDEFTSGVHVYFSEVRELFYGEVKAFIVCKALHRATMNHLELSAVSG